MTTFALIIVGIVIGGIFTILSLVFAIIGLANGKTKNAMAWGAGFLVSLAIVIFSIIAMVRAISTKIQDTANIFSQYDTKADENAYDYQQQERQYWLDSIQKYTNDMYAEKIPADFFLNKKVDVDSTGMINVPFVYPYYIRYNTYNFTGDIMMETSDSIFVQNVSMFALDQNFAIIKVDNSRSPEVLKKNHSEIEYILFDLRTRNFETPANNEKLLDLAKRIGYTGSTDMQYLSTALNGYVENTYD